MTLAKVEENLGTESPLPQGWRWVRLEDICDINPSRPAGFRRAFDALTTFVPMSAVDEHRGTILSAEIRPLSQVAKGYTFFSEGDILFAKITPCMQNGKQAIARGLIDGIGFGSTEFHVIRPRPGVVCEWIHRFVRQPQVLSAAVNHFTGAVGQQRVPESFLASLEIPLPSIDEQERIMHIVNEQMAAVEKARAAAETRLEAVKALPEAYLRSVFQSPEAKRWKRVRLGDVCNDIYRYPSFYGFEHLNSGVPVIRGEHINSRGEISTDWQQYWFVSDDISTQFPRTVLKEGDLVFTVRGTIGKVGIVRSNHSGAQLSPNLIRISPSSKIDASYLWYFFRMTKGTEDSVINNAVTIATVRASDLTNIEFPVPPTLAGQKRIASVLNEQMTTVERICTVVEAELETINALPAALLRRAFTGGL